MADLLEKLQKFQEMVDDYDTRLEKMRMERNSAAAKLKLYTEQYLRSLDTKSATACRGRSRSPDPLGRPSPKPEDVPRSPQASRSPQSRRGPVQQEHLQRSIPYEDKLTPDQGDEFRSPACGDRKKKKEDPIVLSSDEELPSKKPDNNLPENAEKERKALAFAGDKWHADVKQQMDNLENEGKLKEADLDEGSLKALKTLQYEVVLVCLNKIAEEKKAIRDMNAFIVNNCKYLRNQWGVDDAASSSSDDDLSEHDSSEDTRENPMPQNECGKGKASIDETRTRRKRTQPYKHSLNIPRGWLANRLKRGLTRGQARNMWKHMGRDRQEDCHGNQVRQCACEPHH